MPGQFETTTLGRIARADAQVDCAGPSIEYERGALFPRIFSRHGIVLFERLIFKARTE